MNESGRLLWLLTGLLLGAAGVGVFLAQDRPARAANDRFEDFVLCTGPAGARGRVPTDGVWLLDYRTGKLLGTVIDRTAGKILGWAEADLVNEFGIPPRQDVHFLMTTGLVNQGQSALYVAETTTGKFGVYSLTARLDGQPGYAVQRHDMVSFRQAPPAAAAPAAPAEQAPPPKAN